MIVLFEVITLCYNKNKYFKIIKVINPGIPRNPIINALKMFSGRLKPINPPIKFITIKQIPPIIKLEIILPIYFIYFENNLPNTNKLKIAIKYIKYVLYFISMTVLQLLMY